MYWYKKVLLFIGISIFLFFPGCGQKNKINESAKLIKAPKIRVLLGKKGKNWQIETTGDYKILDQSKDLIHKGRKLYGNIQSGKNCIYFGKYKADGSTIYIIPLKSSMIKVNGIPYHGYLICTIRGKNRVRIINVVSIEKYIAGVIAAEMQLSWNDSALCAQAIVSRTFAMCEKRRKQNSYFDVYDNTKSQVYNNQIPEKYRDKIDSVIQKTKGLVLFYRSGLFKPFFHSTCGGCTASAKAVFNYQDITPLSGVVCGFCIDSPHYNWRYKISIPYLIRKLRLGSRVKDIIIKVRKKGQFGRLIDLWLILNNKVKKTIKASELRRRLGTYKIKSTFFVMKKEGNKYYFYGRGFGHGVGLCQYGAYRMGKRGFSPEEILEYYYPGSKIYRLWK